MNFFTSQSRRVYALLNKLGYVPRFAFAHYFLNSDGLQSRIHLQNYYSLFFPGIKESAKATVWLYDSNGKEVSKSKFEIEYMGQIYLELSDLLPGSENFEGMVQVDLAPPKKLRREIASIPNLDSLVMRTPFWVSYRDKHENYMYVHSIEAFLGRVLGAFWPIRFFMKSKLVGGMVWKSWRLLDLSILENLQVITMNHGSKRGKTDLQIFSGDSRLLWSTSLEINSRGSVRVTVPMELLASWKKDSQINSLRIGIDPLLTPNGKPYVLMKYGNGPQSIHHG